VKSRNTYIPVTGNWGDSDQPFEGQTWLAYIIESTRWQWYENDLNLYLI
jgi:hypothetical protein